MSETIDADAVRDDTVRERAVTGLQRIRRQIEAVSTDDPDAEREQLGELADALLGSLRMADDEGAIRAVARHLYGDTDKAFTDRATGVLRALDRYLAGEGS